MRGEARRGAAIYGFQEDFGGGDGALAGVREPRLKESLSKYTGGPAHDCDWRLNGIDMR
jgi:hypothetical protein